MLLQSKVESKIGIMTAFKEMNKFKHYVDYSKVKKTNLSFSLKSIPAGELILSKSD
jgi:hypothetical protein